MRIITFRCSSSLEKELVEALGHYSNHRGLISKWIRDGLRRELHRMRVLRLGGARGGSGSRTKRGIPPEILEFLEQHYVIPEGGEEL